MKTASLALAALTLSLASAAFSAPGGDLKIPLAKPVLTYPQFIAEVKASDGNKNEMIDRVVARRVLLNLKPYGDGNFYVNRQHEIGFTCINAAPKFLGGTTSALIVRYDDDTVGDSPMIFVLDNCTRR